MEVIFDATAHARTERALRQLDAAKKDGPRSHAMRLLAVPRKCAACCVFWRIAPGPQLNHTGKLDDDYALLRRPLALGDSWFGALNKESTAVTFEGGVC